VSIHEHFISHPILLLELIFNFTVLLMPLNFLNISRNHFLLVILNPLLMTLHQTLICLSRLFVFFSIEPRHILMSLSVRVRFLIELGLPRLEGLPVLEFLTVEIEILSH
jgi:hypothetical protein